jgi:hypothetical protein
VKSFIRDSENALKERFPDGLTCFLRCKDELKVPKDKKNWTKYEAELDPKILDKSTFTTLNDALDLQQTKRSI